LEFKLKVTETEAEKMLSEVSGSEFKLGHSKYWKVEDGVAYYSSVCWLYCWTLLENNYKGTMPGLDKLFNELFDFTCEDFNKEVGLKKSEKYRYRKLKNDPKKVKRK